MEAPPHNLRRRYNICPTDPVDVVTAEEGKRELVTMRLGVSPLVVEQAARRTAMATFNARAETVDTKPVFRDAFKWTRCLIPMCGYYEWKDTPSGKQPGTSRPPMAHRFSQLLVLGTNGRTVTQASG